MRYAAKFDVGHVEITRALKRIGWPFRDCARYPGLGFDLLTKHRDGYPVLLELKAEKNGKLTESEEFMRELFPQFFRVAWDLDSALAALGLAQSP